VAAKVCGRLVAGMLLFLVLSLEGTAETAAYAKPASWADTMLLARRLYQEHHGATFHRAAALKGWFSVARDFPAETDWMVQDGVDERGYLAWFSAREANGVVQHLLASVCAELGARGLVYTRPEGVQDTKRLLEHYAALCEQRRQARLRPLRDRFRAIVFTKHYNLGGSHYAYTEGQSDAQHERTFIPGASLCLLALDGLYGGTRTLIDDPKGVIRDPDVSYDGQRILFSWKKSDRADDYHLYEMDVASGKVRQLTFGRGFADYEGAYLPSGDIIFNSTRCVQTVDCWWTEVSNLYTCGPDGQFLRRLSFDQVHTNYPTVTGDGRVLYTRWDYNDRGQVYPQPLFQMNPDGTGQTECYGNNSWFPTTILHARGIPGSSKIAAVLSGHHNHQRGKLALIDPGQGRQEAAGVQLIAPVRATEAVHIDAYGQAGDQFQYPYPLSGSEFLVTYTPYAAPNREYPVPFGLYFMDIDGRRELLVRDPAVSCSQPVPLAPRPRPHVRPSLVDYRRDTGTYYVQDVYAGESLAGVPRGSIQRIRVIALEFRAAGIGDNRCYGPAGGALVSTPIAVGNGSWDVKVVLGDAKVYDDGSACFAVPAQRPVYFQALDAKGHAAQTMRSWSTLQPGERFSCVGCHEHKNGTPLKNAAVSLAVQAGPQALEPFYGPPRGFSFAREIQPILDEHCIRCHNDDSAFSLSGDPVEDRFAKRWWSKAYLALLGAEPGEENGQLRDYRATPNGRVNWIGSQSIPSRLPPYSGGAAKSGLLAMLEQGHGKTCLPQEALDKIACWIDLYVPFCGDYTEAHAWTEKEQGRYQHFLDKRRGQQAAEDANIAALLAAHPGESVPAGSS